MAFPKGFKDLPPPSESATLAELHGLFFTQDDPLPRKFEEKDHAPLITLSSAPLYQTPYRASYHEENPIPPTWALIYYVDLPRLKLTEIYHAVQRLRNTPGDLLAAHLLQRFLHGSEAKIHHDTSEEIIKHIAFHPAQLVLAVATIQRVHLFDLRTNCFLDYYLASDERISSLAFNRTNQLAVALDTGCVHVWTVDLGGEWMPTPQATPISAFFQTRLSPRTLRILARPRRATVERVDLVPEGIVRQDQLVGSVTAVAFSPSGKLLAVGTSRGGVWIRNLIQETSFRAYTGRSKCTCLTWGVPPGVKRSFGPRCQGETGATALIAGMESGLVMYLPVMENGASGFMVDSTPVEFYPGRMMGSGEKAIGQVLLVPSGDGVLGVEALYASFPTLLVSFKHEAGISVFRLIPESVLKASVPSATATAPAEVTVESYVAAAASRLAEMTVMAVTRAIGYGTHDRMRTVYVGTLDTSHVVFSPGRRGYGGAVKSMAIDPTARRLIVGFSHPGEKDSVVWFDASAVMASISVLRALRVLVLRGGGGVGEMCFAGAFEGACAAMVVGGGMAVSVFPAWIGSRKMWTV